MSDKHDVVMAAMQDLSDILDDELNALWAAASRPWYRRFRMPDRDELVAQAIEQRRRAEQGR